MNAQGNDNMPLNGRAEGGNEHCVEEPLTQAQQDFAAILGRLLANLWHAESLAGSLLGEIAGCEAQING